jgi:hypothetical protein
MAPSQLHSKLASIQSRLNTVPKTGVNSSQNYAYFTESDVLRAVRPLLAEHKLSMIIGCTDHIQTQRYEQPGSNGRTRYIRSVLVGMMLTITDSESGESYTVLGYGYGEDDGDKALYKALTGGAKYLVSKAFGLETGDDPEKDDDYNNNTYKETPTPRKSVDKSKLDW